ncbi:hypothetical protein [Robiginitalea aurantiaca]|uniref:Uncharacterized protein n=1 Tax=Robiginitalea aurantiaca TaxID=3056915 RepID=A0ABT7WH30_9FLAO|nr:hypothetical protein [Robiginitalea aurantiaca]MDM9632168.1 hypothetical protein [Robiginitalea aurantiaca]
MYLFLLQFEVPTNKLYEFNLALGRLVKWPVYALHRTGGDQHKEKFEILREWDNSDIMKAELESQAFENLNGMIKVLGEITQSKIFHVSEQKDLLLKHHN